MTKEELLKICQAAGTIGKVSHEEFVNYIIVMSHKKKQGDEWITVENPYMQVDGRLAMANADHARQGKKIDFGKPEILKDDDKALTIGVQVVSEVYGTRYGTATSKKSGSGTASDFPWETAETSAIGRALGAMGYGLLPGTGLTSAEDMERVVRGERKPEKTADGRTINTATGEVEKAHTAVKTITDSQKTTLFKLYKEIWGGTEAEIDEALKIVFVSKFKHPAEEATTAEASTVINEMLKKISEKKEGKS